MTSVAPAQPWLSGAQVGAPAALHPLQAGRGARRASDPAPPVGVTKRTSSGGGGPHASAGALAAEAEAGRAAAAAATCSTSADEGAAPKIKPKRASAHLMRAVLLPRTTDRPQLPSRCRQHAVWRRPLHLPAGPAWTAVHVCAESHCGLGGHNMRVVFHLQHLQHSCVDLLGMAYITTRGTVRMHRSHAFRTQCQALRLMSATGCQSNHVTQTRMTI